MGVAVNSVPELEEAPGGAESVDGAELNGADPEVGEVGSADTGVLGWLLSLAVLLPLAPRALSPVMHLRRCRKACAAA